MKNQARGLFFGQLLYFFAVLDLVYKDLGRLKTGDKMFFNHQSGVARDIAGDFPLALLVNKTSKSAYVDVMAICHRILHHAEKRLH